MTFFLPIPFIIRIRPSLSLRPIDALIVVTQIRHHIAGSSPTSPLRYVIRLSLGRRLVNLLPVAQWTNAFTNGVVDRPWVVGRELESHVHHENAF